MITEIDLPELRTRFLSATGMHGESPSLWRAAFALSSLLQRGETWPGVSDAIAELESLAKERTCGGASATDRAAAIVELLGELGFTGNTSRYEDPANSFVDRVLEQGCGLPITLSVIALHLAEQCGVPLQGIAFPGHFIVGTQLETPDPVVFDLFNGGRRLFPADLAALYRAATGKTITSQAPLLRQCLQPASTRSILTRILKNLQHHYTLRGAHDRAAEVVDLLATLHPGESALRDLQGRLQRRASELN